MDDLIKLVLCIILLITSCLYISHKNEVEMYELTSETIIVDKFITYRQSDACPFYYLVFKDDNGTILQRQVNPDVYYRFEIDVQKGE